MILLQINSLTMRFGGLLALREFSLAIRQGEILGLIGPNGAGKTTLFNCISRLYSPIKGEILMDGIDILKLRPHQIVKTGIARTFQNIELYNNLTVLDNLLISQHSVMDSGVISGALWLKKSQDDEKSIRKRAEEILDYLGLSGLANAFAGGLPLGTRRVVELGRALTLHPKLLLLDEPVAGMNSEEVNHLAQLLLDIRETWGITISLIEHTMGLVMNISDRICVLHYGEKIAEGQPEEIQRNPQVIKAYLGKE